MEKFLRDWRQDALNKHQYESAIFVGDKLLALTNNDKDAFWLAQVHFSTANYTRALGFLSRQDLIARNPSCKYLAAHCYVKQSRYDEALHILGDKNPVHLITSSDRSRRKLQHLDPRNPLGKMAKLPQLRSDRADRSEERDKEDMSNIRFEAAMCYLRGLCYAKQNAFDRAKDCYKDAVRIDVLCFEAFDQLMKNSLMSPAEEWEFLDSLDFDSVSASDTPTSSMQEAGEFTKMLYMTRLSKYSRPDDFNAAVETLSTHYNLSSNSSILLSKAELLFTNRRFRDALALTTQILETDPYNFSALPVHLAALFELKETNALFLLSHDLADTHPEEACTWLAVGTYYLSINRIPEARGYFSKASLMDPHFGPAWIGFAHTFAAEGEHDQAISAYSTAARLFQGTHLPQLFLGMQNLCLGNLSLAREYLETAYTMCENDPLVLNEMGVTYYQDQQFDSAIRTFELAISIAEEVSASSAPAASLDIKTNLAHAYRRNQQYSKALDTFSEVLRLGGKDAGIFSAKGLVLLELEEWFEATVVLHEALALSPQDPIATELLSRALEGLEGETPVADAEDEEMDSILESKLAIAEQRNRRRGRARLGMDSEMENSEIQDVTEVSGVDEEDWTGADESEV
ncbi:anaphase control protein cut9, partial [Aureobasidium melanogenum]|uniref:Anaphase control protein cut9 n=1 Tax=Aureobasidium melanogenum (strain CBS 110374) TaxID=1043003 RepID=A0A074WFA4_AURM1